MSAGLDLLCEPCVARQLAPVSAEHAIGTCSGYCGRHTEQDPDLEICQIKIGSDQGPRCFPGAKDELIEELDGQEREQDGVKTERL